MYRRAISIRSAGPVVATSIRRWTNTASMRRASRPDHGVHHILISFSLLMGNEQASDRLNRHVLHAPVCVHAYRCAQTSPSDADTWIWIWIWNVVDKLPIWGITSTNGDGGLVQATLEAVDGSRLGGFFVQVVPLRDCSGGEFFVCSCGRQGAFELVRVVTSSSWIR